MNEKGERGKSDTQNHFPFGNRCIYDSNNHLLFKVCIFKRMKVCFGTEFIGNVGNVEFVGNYYKNMRNGYE